MRRVTLIALLLLALGTAWAQDGAAVYKSKCAHCHGAQGQGSMGQNWQGRL